MEIQRLLTVKQRNKSLKHKQQATRRLHQAIIKIKVLEQTVTDFYGKPSDKREERQTRKNYLFILSLNFLYHLRIRRRYTEGVLNKTLGHAKNFSHLLWCSRD